MAGRQFRCAGLLRRRSRDGRPRVHLASAALSRDSESIRKFACVTTFSPALATLRGPRRTRPTFAPAKLPAARTARPPSPRRRPRACPSASTALNQARPRPADPAARGTTSPYISGFSAPSAVLEFARTLTVRVFSGSTVGAMKVNARPRFAPADMRGSFSPSRRRDERQLRFIDVRQDPHATNSRSRRASRRQ